MDVKSSIFWDITPCSPFKANRRFGGTYCLHFQGRRISRALKQVARKEINYILLMINKGRPLFLLAIVGDPSATPRGSFFVGMFKRCSNFFTSSSESERVAVTFHLHQGN
jgi:hypothetical protein